MPKAHKLYQMMLNHRMLVFLVCLIALIKSFSFTHQNFATYLIVIEVLFTLLLIAGIFLVSSNRGLLLATVLIAAIAMIILWFNFFINSPQLLLFGLGLEICFYTLTTIVIIKHVLEFDRVTSDKIHGAVSAYFLIAIIWAQAYTALEIAQPHSFIFTHGLQHSSHLVSEYRFYLSEFLYFSFVTLTTLGYGDITPISNAARGLASLEAVAGQIYIAVLIARLVGLHITHTHWERIKILENGDKNKKKRS